MKHLIILLFAAVTAYSQTSDNYPVGVNLSDNGAFVNIVNHTNRYQKCNEFDQNGWPMSDFELVLMDGRPVAEWQGSIDDPEEYRIDYSGTYKCGFTGYAELSVWGSNAEIQNYVYDEQTNSSYFDLYIPGPPAAEHGLVIMTFSNTQRSPEGHSNAGISNLKVMRPGYDLETEQIFTDEFLDLCRAANFECYRYYAVQNIWGCEPQYPEKTLWENRKTPADCSQNSMGSLNGKKDAWCWEYIIELANILDKDIWICIPISCDSNYVRQIAMMLKEELHDNINIYVENSNEVWSPTHMTHGPYNQAQANEYGITFQENYARRTVELSDIFAEVFGTEAINNRIRVILAGQHAYSGRHDAHLNYINTKIGPPNQYIYALSTALYFSSTNPSGNPDEVNEGMLTDIQEQIDDSEKSTYRMNHISRNDQWNFKGKCTSYEGGPHLPAGGGLDNLDNQILAHRTEKMKDIVKKNYKEAWFDIGGGLAMYFILSGSYQRYGCWGLTDDFNYPDRNYKMQAIRDLIGNWTSVSERNLWETDLEAYPNPFHTRTVIAFELPENTYAEINIYNNLGQHVKTVLSEQLPKGSYRVPLESAGMTSGVYYYSLQTTENLEFGTLIMVDK